MRIHNHKENGCIKGEDMKVNILGTEYNLIVNDVLEVPDADGLCKEYTKEISIRKMENMLCDQDTNEDKKKRYDEVLRHEIIHAFFTESGLDDYAGNEQLVDWLAKQFPKIFKAFQECDCL